MLHTRYSGLIHCKKCGKNFKTKRERGVIKYVCAGYDRYGKDFCEREVIKESLLNELVELHFRSDLDTFEVRNYIDRIDIFKDNKMEIVYTDGSKTVRAKNILII